MHKNVAIGDSKFSGDTTLPKPLLVRRGHHLPTPQTLA